MRQQKIRYDGTIYAVDISADRRGLSARTLEPWVPIAPTPTRGVCRGELLRDGAAYAETVTYGRIITTWDAYCGLLQKDASLIWALGVANGVDTYIEITVGKVHTWLTRRIFACVDKVFPVEVTVIE